jgi:hypothetical protein
VTSIYDASGRIRQSSIYPDSCGVDELREYYTYDREGNQTMCEEEIHGLRSDPPPPPPKPPPGETQDQGLRKKTFKHDSQGRLTEYVVRWPGGRISYRAVYVYDDEGRITEHKTLDPAGKLNSRTTYSLRRQEPVPVKKHIFQLGRQSQPGIYLLRISIKLTRRLD